jgi:CHRD domain
VTTRMRVLGPALAAAALATALLAGTAGADDGGRPFRLALSGAEEFNAPGAPINPHGDADRGTIELRLNPGQEEVCWALGPITLTSGDALPHVAHIHRANPGVAGGVVIDLFGTAATGPAPTSYPTGTTCVPASRELLIAVLHDPAAYYVNLHNVPHGGGVMRAQLA